MGSRKIDSRRIERLEAFERSLKVQDCKRRVWESFSMMTDEEMASLYFAFVQLCDKEDLYEDEALFGGGLASAERLEERARPGWQRFCETGGQAAIMDFCRATDDGSTNSLSQGRPFRLLYEGVRVEKKRKEGLSFHINRLGGWRRSKKKALAQFVWLCQNDPSPKEYRGQLRLSSITDSEQRALLLEPLCLAATCKTFKALLQGHNLTLVKSG